MTRFVIPAAGEGSRWGGHLGLPKQLAPVDGTAVLHRTVAALAPHGEVIVVADDDRLDCTHLGARTEPPRRRPELGDIDKIASSAHLWSTTETTTIVFGDIWLSDHAITTITTTDVADWTVYGRLNGSKLTGKRWNENWAIALAPDAHKLALRGIDHVTDLRRRGLIKRNRVSQWYLVMAGVPDGQVCRWPGRSLGHFVEIDDWTEDFDRPEEYDTWLQRRSQALSRA